MNNHGKILIGLVLIGLAFSGGCGPTLSKPGKLYVNVRSEPSGAKVFHGNDPLGVTPLRVEWTVSVAQYNSGLPFRCAELQFYLEGYKPGRKSFLLQLYPNQRETRYNQLVVLEPDPRVVRMPVARRQPQQSQQKQNDEPFGADFRDTLRFNMEVYEFNKKYGK